MSLKSSICAVLCAWWATRLQNQGRLAPSHPGKARTSSCIRGLRIPVVTVVAMVAQPGQPDQFSKGARRQLSVVRDREGRDASRLGQDHVTARLPPKYLASALEGSSRFLARRDWQLTQRRPRPPLYEPSGATAPPDTRESPGEFRERLGFGSPLTDATGDGWALDNQHSSFVAFESHGELHAGKNTGSGRRIWRNTSPAGRGPKGSWFCPKSFAS